ncbi:MAG: hypothetical protein AB9819_04300 [Methanomassiliicoccales archaeon]
MAETRSRRKGCPFCGHMHIYEVICAPYHGVEEDKIPDSIMKGRKPCLTRIIDSNGEFGDEELIQYCVENDIKRIFEKQYFFDPPFFRDGSKLPDDYRWGLIDIFWKCKQCLRTWSPVSRKMFGKCPNCGMNSGISILYGYPSYIGFRSINRGEVSTGGCCIDFNNPIWACKECGHEWGGLVAEFNLDRFEP